MTVRDHRQGARLPRLPGAARPARLARQEQRRPPRHARPVDRHRRRSRAQALRVRRHAQPRRQRHHPQRRAARGPGAHRRRRHRRAVPGSDGGPGRVSELVRHGADARLQPQHDPLWRGSLHAGQARRAGPGQPDSASVPGRRAALRAVPRFGRGDSAATAGSSAGRPVLHQHARRPAPGAPHPRAPEARTCGRSS